MIPSSPFGPSALADLQARTAYEAWLLEAVYEITNDRIAVEDVDELIYPTTGGPPTQTIYAVGNIRIGDWRPGFLEAGAPLVLVTAFKLLDMLLEWVLTENGQTATHKFVQKIAALKRHSIQFPTVIGSRPWLRTRLTALYEQLEPLRGTIIHTRHFQSVGGTLQVSGSKGGKVGAPVSLQQKDLRNLSVVLVSLLKYLDGTWRLDAFREKRIRRALDELRHLHGETSLGQLEPGLLNVRVYMLETESITVDLDAIRRDTSARRPNQDVMFDLRVITINSDGGGTRAFLVPWAEIKDSPSPWIRNAADLAAFERDPPADFDMEAAARDLANPP
jgi:hypothetical protein